MIRVMTFHVEHILRFVPRGTSLIEPRSDLVQLGNAGDGITTWYGDTRSFAQAWCFLGSDPNYARRWSEAFMQRSNEQCSGTHALNRNPIDCFNWRRKILQSGLVHHDR